MTGERAPSRPSFFWQGLLIVLPVVVLVVMGVFSLRQDKRLAQREAEDRAQAIADDLVPLIWNELTTRETNGLKQPSFTVDAGGKLISPPPRAIVPTPKPLDLATLTPEQARLWQALQNIEAHSQNEDSPIQTYEAFIDSAPPDNFAATANYRLGLELARREKFPEAAGRFEFLAEEYPDAVGESGLPLGHLALFRLLEIQPREKDSSIPGFRQARIVYSRPRAQNVVASPLPSNALERTLDQFVTVESLCSNFVSQPTPLTPYLLRKLQDDWTPAEMSPEKVRAGHEPRNANTPEIQESLRKWQGVWTEHELSRELFAAAREHFRTNVGAISSPSLEAAKTLNEESQAETTNRMFSGAISNQPRVEMPGLFWFDTETAVRTSIPGDGINPSSLEIEEQHWLALRSGDAADGIRYVCLAESEIGIRMRSLLEKVKLLPTYFGVGIELTGRTVNEFSPNLRLWHYQHYGGKGGHVDREFQDAPATNVLASAVKMEAGANLLRVNVYLSSPTALFQSQRSRAFSFGLLIVVATVATGLGLFTAWRAFDRQLRLSEMKSNFVSSVSHELRAPIASVRLLAESLERGKVSEPQKQNEYFRFIGQECRRLSALIENVLDFSRIEQGRKQYEFEPTDIHALVEQTMKLMESYAAEKGVRLETSNPEPQPPDLELNVDGRAIQQALVNLIDNAIKHSPKDAVVTVGLETRSAECGVRNGNPEADDLRLATCSLSVTDRGPGIPASEHEKIFARFYRLGSELRRETQGVGIGLSIVKHIIEAHGGRVRVESEPGKGSRFTIELPLNQQKQTEKTEEGK